MPNLPTRDAVLRIAELAERYREAFAEVQNVLDRTDLGRVPAWVFAIDRLPVDELGQIAPELAEAEERRRAWRTALHALIEHVALEDEGEPSLEGPADTEEVAGLIATAVEGAGDAAHLRKLDRFISIVNFAKAGGCIYVDGTFQPVSRAATSRKTPPPAERSGAEMPAGLPEGAHIELLPSGSGSSGG